MNSDPQVTSIRNQLLAESCICAQFGSPMYAHVLEWAAHDVDVGGPCLTVMRAARDPQLGPIGARFLAGLHALVLAGQAEDLAAYYPSVGGDWRRPGLSHVLHKALLNSVETLQTSINLPIQSNEVGRAAALLVGFHVAYHLSSLPLRLLELGSCAGFNLFWDRFFYAGSDWSWGAKCSPVRLTRHFRSGNPVVVNGRIQIVERLGCDKHPLHAGSASDLIRIKSSIWADQASRRFGLLDRACGLLANQSVLVQQGNAAAWLANQTLAIQNVVTVVFHSIVWEYLCGDDRKVIYETLQKAGEAAKSTAPLAWLHLEPIGPERVPCVRLIMWPHNIDVILARCRFDGSGIEIVETPSVNVLRRPSRGD
jgi:hypothetical protein